MTPTGSPKISTPSSTCSRNRSLYHTTSPEAGAYRHRHGKGGQAVLLLLAEAAGDAGEIPGGIVADTAGVDEQKNRQHRQGGRFPVKQGAVVEKREADGDGQQRAARR